MLFALHKIEVFLETEIYQRNLLKYQNLKTFQVADLFRCLIWNVIAYIIKNES